MLSKSSRASITLQLILFLLLAPAAETIRPGTHRRVEKNDLNFAAFSWNLCLLAVQQIFLSLQNVLLNELSGDGGI